MQDKYRKTARILEDAWGPDDPAVRICLDILISLKEQKPFGAEMLSINDLRELGGRRRIDAPLLKAISMLFSPPVNALVRHFIYVDENEEFHEIPEGEYESAVNDGWIAHPVSGGVDKDFQKNVFLYFSISPEYDWRGA